MFEARRLQHHIVSGYIQIVSDGHYLPAFWSHPDLGGPFPGLVLLHEYWGLTPHVRSQARRFAEMGYYVIAPDLFNGQTADTEIQAQALMNQVGETMVSHSAAALHALKSHNRCNSKIGLVGWGMGAQVALRTALVRDDLRALVLFYGLPEQVMMAELRMMACPMLAFFAAQDPDIPSEMVAKLRETVQQVNNDNEVVVYPDVSRGFFDDSRPSFHPVAASDAWNRALEFLNTRLEVSEPPQTDIFNPGRVY